MTVQATLASNNASAKNSTDAASSDSVFQSTGRIREANQIINDVMGELSLYILGMQTSAENYEELLEMRSKLEQSRSLIGAAQEILTVHGLTYGPKFEQNQQFQQQTDSSIHMDATRGRRFHRAIGSVFDALYSLGSMPQLFPGCDPQPGEIDPEYAVRSFTMTAEPILLLMLNMIINEEHLSGQEEQQNLPENLRVAVAAEVEGTDE